jgi:hypothetical protein
MKAHTRLVHVYVHLHSAARSLAGSQNTNETCEHFSALACGHDRVSLACGHDRVSLAFLLEHLDQILRVGEIDVSCAVRGAFSNMLRVVVVVFEQHTYRCKLCLALQQLLPVTSANTHPRKRTVSRRSRTQLSGGASDAHCTHTHTHTHTHTQQAQAPHALIRRCFNRSLGHDWRLFRLVR